MFESLQPHHISLDRNNYINLSLKMSYTLVASSFGKLSSGHRTGKDQFHSNPKERQC